MKKLIASLLCAAMETKDYSKSVKELLDAMVAKVAAGQE